MSQHIYTYDSQHDQLDEIGGAGHIIKDGNGTSYEKRESLQFNGASVVDDSTNNKTIVTPLETNFVGTSAEWNALTAAQKSQYKTVDLTDDFNGEPIDSELSTTSEHTVQNKVITEAVNGKADKVSSATNGNFAGLNSSGNLTDSGKKASDFAPADHSSTETTYGVATTTKYGHVKVDDELSTTSTNPVQNKKVASAIQNLSTEVTSLKETLNDLGLTVVDGKLCAVYNT